MVFVEVNTYKWSQQIADFNYDENREVLKSISTRNLNETDIVNILYVTSLIELLGSKYINFAILLSSCKGFNMTKRKYKTAERASLSNL